MASQGPNSPGTTSNVDYGGSGYILSPSDNVKTADNNCATLATTSPAFTKYLKVTNFGFNIPSGSTINGIKVEIKEYNSGTGYVWDKSLKIVQNDVVSGSDLATDTQWGDTLSYISYGGESELWGLSWSDTDINSTFGVALSVYVYSQSKYPRGEANVDHIRITVYYTEGSSSAIKTVNGLAKASVATADGLANASVKTWNGLA